jgi:hypothetical protein
MTGIANDLIFAKLVPNDTGEEEVIPISEANTMDALVAIRCAFRFAIRLLVRRSTSLESSTMSMPFTGDGVRHRYAKDLSESSAAGESSPPSPFSSSSDD